MLVDAAPKILPEIPPRLGEYAARQLVKRGVEIRVDTTLESVEPYPPSSQRQALPTHTVVWTAGVKASPLLAGSDYRWTSAAASRWTSCCASRGTSTSGRSATAPRSRLATPGEVDPPTSQHALRQARRLAKNLRGEQRPYRYRMLGQVATLGRYKGIADVLGLRFTGFLGWFSRARTAYRLPLSRGSCAW